MLLVVAPALFVSPTNPDEQLVLSVIALFAAFLIFTEYASKAPSLISFRFAAPFNRHRFGVAVVAVSIAICCYQPAGASSTFTQLFQSLGMLVAQAFDFAGSPVRSMVALLPADADNQTLFAFQAAIGASMVGVWCLLVGVAATYKMVQWPPQNQVFNLWANIPTFDPTAGAGVVSRLEFRAKINVLLALSMPYLLPLSIATSLRAIGHSEPLSTTFLVWISALWSILPANFLMRAAACHRVANLIRSQRDKRREAARSAPEPTNAFS